jgi:folate-binding protein YgfZ
VTLPILPGAPRVTRLEPEVITPALTQALRAGAVLAAADVGVLALVGQGAVSCFQGLLTNDVEKAGDGAFVYGALLTPKGMIVVDGWAARQGNEVSFTVPAAGRERAAGIFQKSVPPRLARLEDRTADTVVLRLAGTRSLAIAEAARLPLPPAPGRVVRAVVGPDGDAAAMVARASEVAPFVLQVAAPAAIAGRLRDRLLAAGAEWAEPAALDFTRILAGWPGLESEVDEKTIPQEVRFDEIGGVSYTKGCYTGQETVSRLHFRGHANRQLRGLAFDAAPGRGDGLPVLVAERDVGRVSSVTWLPEGAAGGLAGGGGGGGGRWIGLGVIRHEVEPGTLVRAAGVEARITDLPFALPLIEPA